VNFPFPSGTGLPAFQRAIDEVVAPLAAVFRPDWLLVSAGYDAHRDDLLCSLSLTASGYADLTRRLLVLIPTGRTIFFLEGGYDLDALANSAWATVTAALGRDVHLPGAELETHEAPEAAHRAIDLTKAAVGPYWEGVL
jgi:acetoin utilization deacetylase AcuC-like enzyme